MSDQGVTQLTREKPTYIDVVNALTDRFPILFYVADFVKRQIGQPVYPVRAAVLEFTEGEVRKIDSVAKVKKVAITSYVLISLPHQAIAIIASI
jgi:hypothetical protein